MRLAAALLALALLGAVHAQAPVSTPFLTNLLGGKAQLTAQQAQAVAGAWNMTSHTRLDGPKADKELIAGFEAGSGNGQVDPGEGAAPSAVRGIYWIPRIDPQTGIFAAWLHLSKAGEVISVQRYMGVALGQPDGSVLLSVTSGQDTGVASSLVDAAGQKMATLWMEGLEVMEKNVTAYREGEAAGHYTNQPEVTDNHAVALLMYEKLDDVELEKDVQAQVVDAVRRKWGDA